jgi:GxxExxY protein
MDRQELNRITGIIVDCAVTVHMKLGPGLFEKVYEGALEYELQKRGLRVERQVGVPVIYEELVFPEGYRIDLLVEGVVLIEIKSSEEIARVHFKQTITYLRCANIRIGLLLNFGAETMKYGIRRIINDHVDPT